jgi:hypothetical protein
MAGITPASKSVRRKATLTQGYGPLVVTIAEEGVYYRPLRTRRAFLLPHGTGYLRAVQLATAADLSAKKRKVRRG